MLGRRDAWVGLTLVASATGCAEWPRYGHLPDDDRDLVAAPEDPRTMVATTWEEIAPDDADSPTEVAPRELKHGEGVLIGGTLDGVGWWDDAVPVEFTDAGCPGASGPRSPFASGDWIGDVDWFVGAPAEDAQLCARLEMGPDDDAYGWDLLLVEVDACGIPIAFVEGDDALPLGYGLGGPAGEWSHPVTVGQRYAVALAAYFPNDLHASLSYRLGLSIVWPGADGAPGLCPLLPEPEEAR